MQKDVIFYEEGSSLTAFLQTDVDHHTARPMREAIDAKLFGNKPRILIIDLSKVEFMDSSGLGLILGRAEKAAALNSEVQIKGASQTIMKLIRLSGLERIHNLSVLR